MRAMGVIGFLFKSSPDVGMLIRMFSGGGFYHAKNATEAGGRAHNVFLRV